jgi:putative transposase
VEREKANHEVRRMCRWLGVSPSGYYAWRKRPVCPRRREDTRLEGLIRAIHDRSRGTYGRPRVHAELRFDHGVRCSGKRVARLMRQLGIQGCHRRRRIKTTQRGPEAAPAPDLVGRRFQASGPDQLWLADITYIRTGEGFLYLAGVVDVFSRRVVGWAMREHLRTELVLEALEMALWRRRPGPGVIHHSDQGCQYTAVLFTKRCARAGIEISMGSRGDCYDNATSETFHASIKKERIYRRSWPTHAEARAAIFEYIEGWYNPRRRHSTLGYLSPIEFERHHTELVQVALETSISANGSVASTAPRASDGLTTRRVSTVSVDFVAQPSISPENATVAPTDPAQAATNGSRGTNGNWWPRRSVVKEQARC